MLKRKIITIKKFLFWYKVWFKLYIFANSKISIIHSYWLRMKNVLCLSFQFINKVLDNKIVFLYFVSFFLDNVMITMCFIMTYDSYDSYLCICGIVVNWTRYVALHVRRDYFKIPLLCASAECCPDFILILSRLFRNSLYRNCILILTWFCPDFNLILSCFILISSG